MWVTGELLQDRAVVIDRNRIAGVVTPATLGATTVRVEVVCDDPDAFIVRAVAAGANGSLEETKDHQAPWGVHRQGGFTDPFGHTWLVGDKSPLTPFSSQ